MIDFSICFCSFGDWVFFFGIFLQAGIVTIIINLGLKITSTCSVFGFYSLFSFIFITAFEVCICISDLQIRKPWLGEVKFFVLDHTADNWQIWDFNSSTELQNYLTANYSRG